MSRDAFLNRDRKQSKGYHRSAKQEGELAKRSGGRLVPASGSGAKKGDVSKAYGVFRIEAKTTQAKSFSVTKAMFQKIEESALPHGEIPVFVIEFLDDNGKPECELAVLPTYALEAIGKANG